MASKACGCAEMSSYGAASFDEKHAVFRPPPNQNGIRCRIMLAMLSASAAALVIVGLHFTPTSVPEKEDSTSSVQLTTLATYASNPKYPTVGRRGNSYPWLGESLLIEPYITHTLEVSNPSQTAIYTWTVDGAVIVGTRVPYSCRETKQLSVRVTEEEDGELTGIYEGRWYCKYVRREIRALTDEDRESYFQAMEVIYSTTQEEGERLYGRNFVSLEQLILMHNQLAGDKTCDHAHDGPGFLIAHNAITNVFEKSLQSVNPAVTVPYWDFTIDQVAVNSHGGNMSYWYNSMVFDDDWFGPASSDDEMHIVTQGRWAYTEVRGDLKDSDSVHNAHGLMRAPWNLNKSPYLTRCSTMMGITAQGGPSCTDHYELMKISDWLGFSLFAAKAPHGTVHLLIGGLWGADYAQLFEEIGYDKGKTYIATTNGFSLQKNMWRAGYYVCPEECDGAEDQEKCKCTCPDLAKWENDDHMLNTILGLVYEFSINGMTEDVEGRDIRYEILRIFCNDHPGTSTFLGDQIESASPLDPSFWPIHPTIDRLWHWKRLASPFLDDSWHFDPSMCPGHNPNDVQPFSTIFQGQSRLYTNLELVQLFSPYNQDLEYVYDNFEWQHCVGEGLDMHLLSQLNYV